MDSDDRTGGGYDIRDLVDLDRLRTLFAHFTEATGFTIGFLDHPGMNVLIGTGWRDVCTKFHRSHATTLARCATSNRSLLDRLDTPGMVLVERCENGLVDCATPVIIRGRHLASLATGQLFLEAPDRAWFRRQAEDCGFDVQAYLRAVDEVPVVAEAALRKVTTLLGELAQLVTELGLTNLLAREKGDRLQRDLAERVALEEALVESELRFRTLSENSLSGVYMQEDARFTYVNPALARIFGYAPEELVGASPYLLIHPDDQPRVGEGYRLRMAGVRSAEQFEVRGVRKDGSSNRCMVFATAVTLGARRIVIGNVLDVTEQVQSQERAKALSTMLDTAPAGVIVHEGDGTLLYANRTASVLHGQPPEAFLTLKLLDLIADEERSLAAGRIRMIEGDGEASFETRHVRPDGSTFPLHVRAKAVEWNGRPAILSVQTDLTDRERADEALHRSQATLNAVVDSTRDLIWSVDPSSFGLLTFNAGLRDYFARWRNLSLAQGMRPADLLPTPASAQVWVELYQRALREGPFAAEYVGLAGDSTLEVNFTLLTRGAEVFGVSVFARDITERKRNEAERERLTKAIEQAGEMIVVTDAAGAIQYVNPAFEQTTGYARAEVVGRTPRVLKSGRQDAEFYRALWDTITAGHVWHGRFVNKRKDGTEYTEQATISPVRDAAGAITSYVAVKRDITRDLSLEEQLLQSQRMEGIGRLAGGVAHDFNNLLSVILSCTEFALAGAPAELEDDLREVVKAAERAAVLTRQLLAFSRKQVLQTVPLNLNDVVTGFDKMLRRILEENVELKMSLAPDLGVVRADPGQLEQVLMNLVVNARDAMPEGGTILIETSNTTVDEAFAAQSGGFTPGPYVLLSVTDKGVGMEPRTLARIFEPFFTTKEKGKGTGLGLSTVYGIVKQSGGEIRVRSEPGRGTAFKIYLPREASATTAAIKAPSVPRGAGGTETVLLVEDEEALRRVATRSLETAGYTILVAADGEDAVRVSEGHPGRIDLLLTDVIMPRLGGKALAQELAKTRPELRVLYMSGYTDDAIAQHGTLAPETQLISKPFTSDDLRRRVREVLDAPVPCRSRRW